MSLRPADFFLGAIELFGILVPGAALLLLQSGMIEELPYFDSALVPGPGSGAFSWLLFFGAAYVLGHFLLGVGVPLNRLIRIYPSAGLESLYLEVKNRIEPALPEPPPLPESSLPRPLRAPLQWLSAHDPRSAAFNRAFSQIRLDSPAAAGVIERQAAEYKLFRSLTLVFLLDLALEWYGAGRITSRVTLDVALMLLAGLRFLFLLAWTRRLSFEFYTLLHAMRRPAAATGSEPKNETTAGT